MVVASLALGIFGILRTQSHDLVTYSDSGSIHRASGQFVDVVLEVQRDMDPVSLIVGALGAGRAAGVADTASTTARPRGSGELVRRHRVTGRPRSVLGMQ